MSQPRKRYHRALRQLETLEPRTLMSASVLTVPGVAANFGVYDDSGALWVLNGNSNSVDKINPTTLTVDATIPLNSSVSPDIIVGGIGNIAYVRDANGPFGGIDIVDLAGGSVIGHFAATSGADSPLVLTQTPDGAAWFVGNNDFTLDEGNVAHHNTLVGRIDPTGSVSEFTTGLSVVGTTNFDDSVATAIAPSGDSSVWIGYSAATEGIIPGTGRIGAASYDGTAHLDNVYTVNSGNATSDHNIITSLVDDGAGKVWFSLANDPSLPVPGPDMIVSGQLVSGNLVQQGHQIAPDASSSLIVGGLQADANGSIWFMEASGSQFGNIDTSGVHFQNNTTGASIVSSAINGDGTQVSFLTAGNDSVTGYPILQVDITPTTTTTFAFVSGANITIREETALPQTTLAKFTAPAGSYSATITWGDNTTSTVTPVVDPSDPSGTLWDVNISGKAFASQGNYNGTVSVSDGVSVLGSQNFTSTVSDIPLTVQTFNVTNLAARVVIATGSFTDDGDLPISTWSATVTWGDGATTKAVILRDPTQSGRYFIMAVHAYRSHFHGVATLKVITSEPGVLPTSGTLTANVNV